MAKAVCLPPWSILPAAFKEKIDQPSRLVQKKCSKRKAIAAWNQPFSFGVDDENLTPKGTGDETICFSGGVRAARRACPGAVDDPDENGYDHDDRSGRRDRDARVHHPRASGRRGSACRV